MENYKDLKKRLLRDKETRKAYEDLGPEFAVVEMIIEKRLQKGITQKELARKAGTKQPVISRLERGDFSPSIKFLQRIAEALGAELRFSIS
ncbi:XRE family transcriptional regulator [bacterium]|nr:MAG: XRE family transcriptional regulator [bacterium]